MENADESDLTEESPVEEIAYLTEAEVRVTVTDLLTRFPTLRENLRDR